MIVNPIFDSGLQPKLTLVQAVRVRADLGEHDAGAVNADAGLAEEVAGFGAGQEFVTHGRGGVGLGWLS
jgi:hypothetical protein